MTIADILPDILVECGIDDVSADIASTDFQMRQLRSLMNAAGDDIATRTEWAGATAETTVSAGLSSSVLPDDFQEMAEGGSVNVGTGYNPSRAVVSPSMWQLLTANPSSTPHHHQKGGSIYFSPVLPTGGATIRYVSKNWVSGASEVTDGADVPIFPENLLARATIYRWKRQKGLPFDDLMAEFEADLETAIKADRGLA